MSSSASTIAGDRKSPRIYSREAVLFGWIILLVLFVLFTAAASRLYHKSIHVLADSWFAQGDVSFQSRRFQVRLEGRILAKMERLRKFALPS